MENLVWVRVNVSSPNIVAFRCQNGLNRHISWIFIWYTFIVLLFAMNQRYGTNLTALHMLILHASCKPKAVA